MTEPQPDPAPPQEPYRPRGAPGRVAEAQRQLRPTLVLTALFLISAAASAATSPRTGRWLPLHLALAGALILAVSGATQFLTVTWGTAPAPSARTVTTQRWLVAVGAACVAVGREYEIDALTGAGALALIAGLVLLDVVLIRIARTAVQPRVRPAVAAYVTGVSVGIIGVVLGAILGVSHALELEHWRDVHETLNLLGLAGFVVAGTLPFFVATQSKMKASPRATPRSQFTAQAVMGGALTCIVIGVLARSAAVSAAGLGAYAAALLGILTLLPRLGRKQFRWAGPRLLQTGSALIWWVGAIVTAAVHAAIGHAPFSGAVVAALVVGAYVQLIVASLGYLGPVLVGGGGEVLTSSFAIARSWIGLVAGNVSAAAACASWPPAVWAVALGVWSTDGGVRAVLLIRRRVRLTRQR